MKKGNAALCCIPLVFDDIISCNTTFTLNNVNKCKHVIIVMQ